MVMTIDIPEAAVAAAKARGIEVEALLKETFDPPAEPAKLTPAEAVAGIRSMRGLLKLPEGMSVSQLIKESRRG